MPTALKAAEPTRYSDTSAGEPTLTAVKKLVLVAVLFVLAAIAANKARGV